MLWPSLAALVVSVAALLLSWLAYRQRARYHPQPKLVASWDRVASERDGVRTLGVVITNHGDASARDLEAVVPSSARGLAPWQSRIELAPGHGWGLVVPTQIGADWHDGARDPVFTLADRSGREARPLVVVYWRQSPFSGRKKRVTFRGPKDYPRSD